MLNKKADFAVAGVILLLGALFVGYLAALPKDDKCKVFPDLEECNGDNKTIGNGTLLSEEPGLLEPIEDSIEYKLGGMELFNREVSELPLKITTDPIVETSWFNSRKIDQEFLVPGKVKKILLFTTIGETSSFSALYVIINGKTVDKLVGEGTHITELPIDLIRRENTLTLKASTPILPGSTNRFSVEAIILKETYELTQSQTVRNFIIEQDIDDITSAVLEFQADCYSEEPLRVFLNNKTITDEKVCADYENDISNLLLENNRISFSSNGNYFIHDANIKVRFNKKDFATYYFSIDREEFDKIEDGKVLAFLKLRFPDTEKKELTVYINGNPVNVEARKIEFKTAIGELLKLGQNSVKIVPETAVSIGSVEIVLE